jgi:nicotinate-nucleotide adenylyltransferase
MNIGLFGGSFNPPHYGHLLLAEMVREQFSLSAVVFIPSFVPPHKQLDHLAPGKDRLAMVECAIAGNKNFQCSDFEIRREGTSYTIQTVTEYEERYPHSQLFLIIGIDNLIDFKTWKSQEELLTKTTLIVCDRPGFHRDDIPRDLVRHANFVSAPLIGISSSDIRLRIKTSKSIRYFVPEAVAEYIRTNRLYL